MNLGEATGGSKVRKEKLTLTSNNTKVLGKYERRREKVVPASQFQTRNYKTINSSWTPVVHKPSNEQIYNERRELVCHWFDLWTDKQRKRFLDLILKQCTRSQLLFVQQWYRDRVPLRHLDFTTVLPRFISTYIMSFLNPKDLCRTGMVSWHWKAIAEQDILWRPKCIKYGWYLPYLPPDNEYGAWKKHYTACVKTMDYVISANASEQYGTFGDGSLASFKKLQKDEMKKAKEIQEELDRTKERFPAKLSPRSSRMLMEVRPPWQYTDSNPKEIEKASRALIHQFDPNSPQLRESQLLFHNRFGIMKKHARAKTEPPNHEYGLNEQGRRKKYRTLSNGDVHFEKFDLAHSTLTECLDFEHYEESRLMQIIQMDWAPPKNVAIHERPHLAGGIHGSMAVHPRDASRYYSHPNPRVVFISSRIHAADVLLDAVMFGVIPIVYEYEGTSLESLMSRLKSILDGRTAKSIGIFVHYDVLGEACLVNGVTAEYDSLELPDVREFFECVATHTESGTGHVDLFVPLAVCDEGYEMLVQLKMLTGVTFSSPTGLFGNYNHINTEWLKTPEDIAPPFLYFEKSKMHVWINMADQVHEAVQVTNKLMATYFEEKHRDVVSQMTGQVIFDALGQVDIQGADEITEALVEGIVQLSKQKNIKPLEFLGKYLLQLSGGKSDMNIGNSVKKAGGATKTLSSVLNDEDEEVKHLTLHYEPDNNCECSIEEDIKEEDDVNEKENQETQEKEFRRQKKMSHIKHTMGNKRLTAKEFSVAPDKRTVIAYEMLSSEVDYVRTLEMIRDAFVIPLRKTIESNRAIINAGNMKTIFSDVMSIAEVSRSLMEDLEDRIEDWGQHQCVGDVFIKFCTNLKSYTNFLNNYTAILSTIERVQESNPDFRAFLKRHNKTPGTKMLSLQELLLTPTRRPGEYVKLLIWLKTYTPHDHADRDDIAQAIKTLSGVDDIIKQAKLRQERERQLQGIQKIIMNSPNLLEANRYLLKHEDFAHLVPPAKTIRPELRMYQHTETLGLFLFNDALVFSRRTTNHFPFERSVDNTYRYEYCIGLTRLNIGDIPDSRYVKNAFKLWTPKRKWYLSSHSYDAKYNWVTLLHKAIKTAIQNG